MSKRRRHLRPVGRDERTDAAQPGSIPVIIEDLEVAHGYVVEAAAEAGEVDPPADALVDTLIVANSAVNQALRAAHEAADRKETP